VRRAAALALLLACALLCLPAAAQAAFSIAEFKVAAKKSNGIAETQAGAHPFAFQANLDFGTEAGAQRLRDATVHMPSGLLINPTAVNECNEAAFGEPRSATKPGSLSGESCANPTQVGVIRVDVGGTVRWFGLFNLIPPFGSAAAIGASPFGTPLVFMVGVREADAGLDLVLKDVPQSLDLRSLQLTIWGTPWIPAAPPPGGSPPPLGPHDDQRGNCLDEETGGSLASDCQVLGPGIYEPLSLIKSYVTLPTTPCGVAPSFSAEATSWSGEEAKASASILPLAKCNEALTVVTVKLMSDLAASRTGLAFNLDVSDGGGITNPGGIARPAIKTAISSLPEGLTINPSLGAGLGVCSEAQFASESAGSEPGAGCPNNSKIGDVVAEGVLGLEEPLKGGLYLATPYANPYHSLLALYMVARSPRRGIGLKSIGRLEPDPRNGKLVATFDELPRLLYTHFSLTLREGQRSTLVSPPTCGTYRAALEIASWAKPTLFIPDASYFAINHDETGGPCPSGGIPPFAPGLLAGSINPAAGAYTPFYLRMTRSDSEQEITSYSATFPPGLLGKLAGVATCSDTAIEAAKQKSGQQELASPSCPASSLIGHTIAGYGVGGVLAYAPGALYLAGPYHGAPLSTVAIDSALVGPFDLGVVTVRSAIRVDPKTAQASIDSQGSDPIPHILAGIPLHLRDIRVFVDRPNFTLNPTSCDPTRVSSLLGGAGADPFSTADEATATSVQRFQVLSCTLLGFKPKLAFRMRGGTRRGSHPSLRAVYTARAGDANLATAQVTLPPAVFLAQNHIRTVCTRVQFRTDNCPPGSIYGHATAITPLLDEPLSGPVILRSSDHSLPDIVAAIEGRGIEIEVVGRIDSSRGGIRASFENLPDGPVTKFTMTLDGGRHSTLELAGNLCAKEQRANARFTAQSNATEVTHPLLKAKCPQKKKPKGKKR
jgi:hypothetical protein